MCLSGRHHLPQCYPAAQLSDTACSPAWSACLSLAAPSHSPPHLPPPRLTPAPPHPPHPDALQFAFTWGVALPPSSVVLPQTLSKIPVVSRAY